MPSEECDFLTKEANQYIEDLAEKIYKKRVILFVGAGLSSNARRKDGALDKQFPLWPDLMKKMLVKLYGKDDPRVKNQKNDYFVVPDKFEAEFGRNSLIQLLEETLEDSEFAPGDIHRLISRFNWEVITTNFDTLIERGYYLNSKKPNLVFVDSDLTFIEQPRMFKINGCIKHARDQIIITGEDFRTFSDNKPLIELYVKKCFIESTVLFVGFSLDDPAFQMIHGWVRDRLLDKKANRFAYSIQLYEDDATKKIWQPRGIRFIELFPGGDIDDALTERRLYSIFDWLYHHQIKKQKADGSPENGGKTNDSDELIKKLEDSFSDFEKEAKQYEADCQLENLSIQQKLEKEMKAGIGLTSLPEFLDILGKPAGGKTNTLLEVFIRLMKTYLCDNYRENILYQLLKDIIILLKKENILKNQLLSKTLNQILEHLIMADDTYQVSDPNVWVMALYIALRIGVNQKLLAVDFFRRGFGVLQKKVKEGGRGQIVSTDLLHYWLFALLLIGPFDCAKNLRAICRKTNFRNSDWDIPKAVHFHLEAFFGKRLKHLDLFLEAVNRFRNANKAEALHKFSLMDAFLSEYEKQGFNDLFITDTYQTLTGEFREKNQQYRGELSSIRSPVESKYFQQTLNTVFDSMVDGRSLLATDISSFILSFPEIIMEKREIDSLKRTSAGELFLLAVLYDIPSMTQKKEEELRRLMTFMIDKEIIQVSYFLELLLFRLEGTGLDGMEQSGDNGILRYFWALTSFLSCARPHLKKKDLIKIKDTINKCLANIKKRDIQEALIRTVGYALDQLPDEDFSAVLKTIFSIAAEDRYDSIGLGHIKLKSGSEVIKLSQLRLILDQCLEKRGSEAERDFSAFLLNHHRDELFPKDRQIDQALKAYFEFYFKRDQYFSLQWLMDIQMFIEKGFIVFDNKTEERVKKFLQDALKTPSVLYDWKLFAKKMIPVYKRLSLLFDSRLIGNIIDGFLKNTRGDDISVKDLDDETREGFAHFLVEISQSPHYAETGLKKKVEQNMKNLAKAGFIGGGYAAAFWDILSDKAKATLSQVILDMWQLDAGKDIVKAVKAAGNFLKYKTDKTIMEELSNRLIYSAFSASPPVKIVLCDLFIQHADPSGQETGTQWFKERETQIFNLLPYLRKEKDLEFLGVLTRFLEVLKEKETLPEQVKETVAYLKTKAPYAETRRAIERLF